MTEFITRNYGQKEFEVIIKTDSKDHYKASEDFARRLIDHTKPQTEADRIRSMSDEALAQYLYALANKDFELTFCQNKPECLALVDTDEGVPEEHCRACLLEYLQRPADEC